MTHALTIEAPDALLTAPDTTRALTLGPTALVGYAVGDAQRWRVDRWHTLDEAHVARLSALSGLESLTLHTLDLASWLRLIKARLPALRELTLDTCAFHSAHWSGLDGACWPALERLTWRLAPGVYPPTLHIDDLHMFARHSTLTTLQTITLPNLYIYGPAAQPLWDGDCLVGYDGSPATQAELLAALTPRWPKLQLIII